MHFSTTMDKGFRDKYLSMAILNGDPGFLSLGLLVLVLALVMGYWVYSDAESKGNDNAMLWGLAVGLLTLFTVLGGVIALIIYILKQ